MTLAPLGDGWFGSGTARARLRRDGDDLVVASLECADEAACDAFLDELARTVTQTSRVVDENGSVLRAVAVAPVDLPHPLTLARLEDAIRDSWSAETSDDPAAWSEANPAFQQCDVTAHVVRDYLGGEILACGVVLDGRRVDRHAWNRLPSGLELDLTREQFRGGEQYERPEVVAELGLGATHRERYELLAERVRANLGS